VRTRRSRRRWPVIGAAAGVLVGVVLHGRQPAIYEASTSILVIPQRVPEDVVRPTVTASLGERLNTISEQVLSRVRLERTVREFRLYQNQWDILSMEDVIRQMRSDISLNMSLPADNKSATSFTVGFKSPDSRTAMRVTERLAYFFVLERRQVGEQFKVIDAARLPERPIGPARLPYVLWGALGGLAASLLLLLLSSMWRGRREPAPEP
jgi:uncharacterized protein involved in exopolysaccharide biosynthesis